MRDIIDHHCRSAAGVSLSTSTRSDTTKSRYWVTTIGSPVVETTLVIAIIRSQPRREVSGFVPPDLAQRNLIQRCDFNHRTRLPLAKTGSEKALRAFVG